MKMQVVRLVESAKIPHFAHESDAGMDLFCSESVTIPPQERVQIKTGIALAIPDGHVGLIWDKSGLSHRYGLKTVGGVIDAGYRGEVIVGMVNLGTEEHTFLVGDKIAQMLIQKVEHPTLEEVTELGETLRGEKGFGSSGT
jgi:dUTP pyrophosphatase